MENNLDIFVIAHKPFEHPLKSDFYTIVSNNDEFTSDQKLQVKNINSNGIEHFYNIRHGYCENVPMLWIAKNVELKEYVGFCHYRVFYPFINKFPSKIIDNYDMYCLGVHPGQTLYFDYGYFHNSEDFDILIDIIQDLYPEWADEFKKYVNDPSIKFHGRNMYITKREIFLQITSIIESIMIEFDKRLGLNSDEDVEKYIISRYDDVFKDKKSDLSREINYQARLQGFLIERVVSFLIDKLIDPERIKITNTTIVYGDRI